MKINIYQVDAFTSSVFRGNPAAVCPLDSWLSDELLQNIATENNLSETAFFVKEADGYCLRWFTPNGEVDLCGHATLATAHVLFQHLNDTSSEIEFYTRSGTLLVKQCDAGYQMRFPATQIEKVVAPDLLLHGLGVEPLEVLLGFDYCVVLENEAEVHAIQPDYNLLSKLEYRGVVVTAIGDDCDFVSRCFFPKLNVNEDPVTGSAHCELAPYWAQKLSKNKLTAKQLSKRVGELECRIEGDSVILIGNAADYMKGVVTIR
ncbi:isomerase [Shewanella sp. OPT22]|nr:isomerase [Shewanella sp. OPT22]